MRRLYFLLILLCWSGVSSASSLSYWTDNPYNAPGGYVTSRSASYQAACSKLKPTLVGNEYWQYRADGSSKYYCDLNNGWGSTTYKGYAQLVSEFCQYGHESGATQCNSSCDAPSTMVDGQCVAPAPDPCFALYGQSKGFTLSGNSNDPGAFYQPIEGTKYWSHPNSVVLGGCAATVNPGTKCPVDGDGAYICVGTATYQGISADPSTGEPGSDECSAEDCPDTEPTPSSGGSSECTNWVEDAEGRRTRTCETTSESNKPGQAKCLTDGSLVCVSAAPKPTSTVTSTSSDQSKTTDAATGNTTTVENNTTNKTYCAAGACTTSTTTNKSTTINNAAGEQIGKSGECSGPLCASATNPDVDGDGLGDCIKDCGEEEEEQEGSATVSESCDAAPACEGDPFQCAILVQVHYNSCQERRPLNEEEAQSIEQAISAGETATEQAQVELDSSLGQFFAGFQAAASGNTSGGSGVCWPDKVISMPFGASFVMPFSQVCPFVELFRMALLAMAYLVAARIIHTQI